MRNEKGVTPGESLNDSSSSLIPPPSTPLPVLSLLTDFGTADYFVGAMKGAILSVNSRAQIVDITHEIPAHDIRAAAFTLLAAYGTFPPKTVHVCVVDPGVGSSRRPILVKAGDYFFVGPDNGLFSYVYDTEADAQVFHLNRTEFFRQPLSHTFHGRDIFGPVAGAVSNGIEPEQLGSEIRDFVRLDPLRVREVNGGLAAQVIHIDRFGNCITDITPQDLTEEMLKEGARLLVAGREITSFRQFFAEEEGRELFAVWGSAGFLEIVAFQSSAAHLLNIGRGEQVLVLTA